MRPLDILVVWTNPNHRIRTAYYDLVYAFRRHSGHRCIYWNTFHGHIPTALLKIKYDLIIFNALFMSEKWSPKCFEIACQRVAPLKKLDAFKIAMPQDEYVYSDLCCDFLNEFRVDHLCTLGPAADWSIIYGKLDRRRITIEQILPGYLEPRTVARIAAIGTTLASRPLHIAYRTWLAEPWLGRAGQLKGRIGKAFAIAAAKVKLPTDISVDLKDSIIGDHWYRFLASSKYTLGAEGGSSIHDPDGSIRARTEAYVRANPHASFEEVEAACFAGCDGSIQHTMITPRHLEAASTRTVQILVEAQYNGILKPWRHYIPVKPDLSNVDEVLETSLNEDLRRDLAESSYRDLVDSDRFSYRHFVQDLLHRMEPRLQPVRKGLLIQVHSSLIRIRAHLAQNLATRDHFVFRPWLRSLEAGCAAPVNWIRQLRQKLAVRTRARIVLSRIRQTLAIRTRARAIVTGMRHFLRPRTRARKFLGMARRARDSLLHSRSRRPYL